MNTNYTILKAFSGGGASLCFRKRKRLLYLKHVTKNDVTPPPENGNIFHIGKFKINESVNIRLW